MMKYTPRVRSEIAPMTSATSAVTPTVASRCTPPEGTPSLIRIAVT